jgi:hypothetical protein
MTMKSIKFSPSVVWISAMVLLTASKAWAADDIPPLDPLVATVSRFFRDLWVLCSGYFC